MKAWSLLIQTETAFQIFDDIINILRTDRQTNRIAVDSLLISALPRQLCMRGGSPDG